MNDYMIYIKEKLTKRELLEQLAEECCELGQASLKLIRAAGFSGNVTPVSLDEATNNFLEELDDVLMVASLISDLENTDMKSYIPLREKWQRWAKRLGYKEGAE